MDKLPKFMDFVVLFMLFFGVAACGIACELVSIRRLLEKMYYRKDPRL